MRKSLERVIKQKKKKKKKKRKKQEDIPSMKRKKEG
jgi:hypothetical protein